MLENLSKRNESKKKVFFFLNNYLINWAKIKRWHDGFSIMYVNGLGYIYKHTLQRVMTQEDESAYAKKNKNINLNVI